MLTSILLCFGGGVLLSTAMLHIFPEASEGLASAGAKLEIEWLPHLVFCSGFFLIYLIEELVDPLLGHSPTSKHLHRDFSLKKSNNEEGEENPTQVNVDETQDKSQRVGAIRDFFTSKKNRMSQKKQFFGTRCTN